MVGGAGSPEFEASKGWTRVASEAHEAMVARLIEDGARTPEVPPSRQDLALMRYAAKGELTAPEGTTVTFTNAGGVGAFWVTPTGDIGPATIVYFHGGGYINNTVAGFLPVLGALSMAARARVLGVEYRKAPEHPFPAAVEDAVAAYRWLIDLGVPAASIIFAGDSAGGGLVIAAMLALRLRGLDLPAGGVAFSPWTDLTVSGDSVSTAGDPICTAKGLALMAETYLAGADPFESTASPLFGELSGLPPMLIQVGTREALLDDSRRFTKRALESGVEVNLVELKDVVHMWIRFDPTIPESKDAFRRVGEFVTSLVPVA